MSYAEIVLATFPAAPPARNNQRATSWPAPISAIVPYQRGSKLIRSAFCRVPTAGSIERSPLRSGRSSRTNGCRHIVALRCPTPSTLPARSAVSNLGYGGRREADVTIANNRQVVEALPGRAQVGARQEHPQSATYLIHVGVQEEPVVHHRPEPGLSRNAFFAFDRVTDIALRENQHCDLPGLAWQEQGSAKHDWRWPTTRPGRVLSGVSRQRGMDSAGDLPEANSGPAGAWPRRRPPGTLGSCHPIARRGRFRSRTVRSGSPARSGSVR